MNTIRAYWGDFLDWLLGDRCTACGDRVYAKDRLKHKWIDHSGYGYFGDDR